MSFIKKNGGVQMQVTRERFFSGEMSDAPAVDWLNERVISHSNKQGLLRRE